MSGRTEESGQCLPFGGAGAAIDRPARRPLRRAVSLCSEHAHAQHDLPRITYLQDDGRVTDDSHRRPADGCKVTDSELRVSQDAEHTAARVMKHVEYVAAPQESAEGRGEHQPARSGRHGFTRGSSERRSLPAADRPQTQAHPASRTTPRVTRWSVRQRPPETGPVSTREHDNDIKPMDIIINGRFHETADHNDDSADMTSSYDEHDTFKRAKTNNRHRRLVKSFHHLKHETPADPEGQGQGHLAEESEPSCVGAITNTTQILIKQKVSKRMYTFHPPMSTDDQTNRALGTPQNQDGSRTGALSPRRLSFRTKKRRPVIDKGSPVTAMPESATIATGFTLNPGTGQQPPASSTWPPVGTSDLDLFTPGLLKSSIKRAMSLPRVNVVMEKEAAAARSLSETLQAETAMTDTNAPLVGSLANGLPRTRSMVSLASEQGADEERSEAERGSVTGSHHKKEALAMKARLANAPPKTMMRPISERSALVKRRQDKEALGLTFFEMATPGSTERSKIVPMSPNKVWSV